MFHVYKETKKTFSRFLKKHNTSKKSTMVMAFFEYRRPGWVEMVYSSAIPQISVDRMKATEVVLMAVLRNIGKVVSVESSLHKQVQHQIQLIITLLTRMQTFTSSREKRLYTIDVSVEIHKL
jgi:hypothetical protein